jgi:hypothetical protein
MKKITRFSSVLVFFSFFSTLSLATFVSAQDETSNFYPKGITGMASPAGTDSSDSITDWLRNLIDGDKPKTGLPQIRQLGNPSMPPTGANPPLYAIDGQGNLEILDKRPDCSNPMNAAMPQCNPLSGMAPMKEQRVQETRPDCSNPMNAAMPQCNPISSMKTMKQQRNSEVGPDCSKSINAAMPQCNPISNMPPGYVPWQ